LQKIKDIYDTPDTYI
jgi:uncharacterized protein with WD repeat